MFSVRPVRFSVILVGETGSGKSGWASLALNLFGKEFAYDRLSDNWNSTPKSLLDLITRAMDVMVVIDDYVEKAGPGAAYQQAAREQINRAIGNGAARNVQNRDGSRRDGRKVGALVVST
ncbi:DUF927 domain-containing protein, partial [Acinetobacter baumannii]|uniref:DUF927 domain-containing protein n=1 Tax=Acinetobacter baumannii TaxID=470 RepID=UPI00189A9350